MIIESGVRSAAVGLSLVVERWLSFKPLQPGVPASPWVSRCPDWLISPVLPELRRVGEVEAGVAGARLARDAARTPCTGRGSRESRRLSCPHGAQDATRVLDETALECDWRGEEQGVQGWAVEVSGSGCLQNQRARRRHLSGCAEPRPGCPRQVVVRGRFAAVML